jgi:adenine/guanine phosphoribosyltransferase-like PRPP-binding protein
MGDTVALEELVLRAEDLAARTDDEWPFDAAELGEDLEFELADPQIFKAVAEEISRLAELGGFDAVIGASRLGERLAGAATAFASNGLRPAASNQELEHALIVDGLLVTGVRLQEVADALAERGIRTAAAVVLAVGDVAEIQLRHIDGISLVTPD